MRTYKNLASLILLVVVTACSSPMDEEQLRTVLPTRVVQNDGNLLFTISLLTDAQDPCYRSGDTLLLQIVFKNISSRNLALRTDFRIRPSGHGAHPNYTLFPKISTSSNEDIEFGELYIDTLNFVRPQSKDFYQLPSDNTYQTNVEFYFPTDSIVRSSSVPISAGNYLLQFTYINQWLGPSADHQVVQYDWNAWVGEVESNQIEICIQNP